MKVTKLSRTKNGKRINVFLNNEFTFAIEENTLLKFDIYKDYELSESEKEKILEYDMSEYGYRQAIHYLERRLRSEKEIKDYLTKKLKDTRSEKIEKNILIEKIIERLSESNYINDHEFALQLIKARKRRGNKSALEIEKDLRKYGIDKEIYENLLKIEYNPTQEVATVERLIEKKLASGRIKNLPPAQRKQKVIEYLLRKGFRWEMINKSNIMTDEKINK